MAGILIEHNRSDRRFLPIDRGLTHKYGKVFRAASITHYDTDEKEEAVVVVDTRVLVVEGRLYDIQRYGCNQLVSVREKVSLVNEI